MGEISDRASAVFRDNVIDGLPASGPNNPDKTDIRSLFALIEAILGGAVSGLRFYATKAALDADTTRPAGTLAYVYDDPSDANNTIYHYEPGGWVKDTAYYGGLVAAVQPLLDKKLSIDTASGLARPGLSEPPRQVFNALDATPSAGITTAGATVSLGPEYSLTDWLQVRPGGKMQVSEGVTFGGSGYGVVFFNAARQRVSAVGGDIAAGQIFDVPANAPFARYTLASSSSRRLVVTDAVANTNLPSDALTAQASEIVGLARSAFTRFGDNAYSPSNAVSGALVAATGEIVTAGGFSVSDFIPIPPLAPLLLDEQQAVGAGFGPVFYDAGKRRIWYAPTVGAGGITLSPPPAARFMRLTLTTGQVQSYRVVLWGVNAPWAQGSLWTGRQAAILGDSITAAQQNWFGQVCGRLGMALQTRAAFPGRRMVNALLKSDDATSLTAADFAGVDLTLLFLGTNNAFDQTPIGAVTDTTSAATFIGQAKKAVETVLTWQPEQRFVICSLLYRNDGVNVRPYCDALEAVANFYALPFFDLNRRSGVSSFNASWAIPDGLHPSNDGYRRLLVPAATGLLQGVAPVNP